MENLFNERYTFENYIVGDRNRQTYEVCHAIAEKQDFHSYNPLVIYGNSGLGKTHLMQAIAQHIISKTKEVRVLYVSGEELLDDYIISLAEKKKNEFYEKYSNADVLLIDNVLHLFKGKEATQKKFFEMFQQFLADGTQMIISADTSPKEWNQYTKEFSLFFQQGTMLEVSNLEYDTKMTLLKKYAKSIQLDEITDEEIAYIIENNADDIRELQGLLNREKLLSCGEKENRNYEKDFARDVIIYQDSEYTVSVDFYTRPAVICLSSKHKILLKMDVNKKYLSGNKAYFDSMVKWFSSVEKKFEDIIWEWNTGNDDFERIQDKLILD